jgi:N-acetylglucosamine-6-phosphate deacetylase
LQLHDHGRLMPGAVADIVAIDAEGRIRQVWIDGVAALAR